MIKYDFFFHSGGRGGLIMTYISQDVKYEISSEGRGYMFSTFLQVNFGNSRNFLIEIFVKKREKRRKIMKPKLFEGG